MLISYFKKYYFHLEPDTTGNLGPHVILCHSYKDVSSIIIMKQIGLH